VEIAFTLKAIAKALVLPPAGPILLALVGLLVTRHAPRAGRALIWTGALSLVLLCLPVVAWLLARPFDMRPLDHTEAKRAQAIVILGGGTRRLAPEYGGDTMARFTAERVRYGARVARQTGLPVLVTGGTPRLATRSEAELMRQALEDEFGIQVRWVEKQSANTHENAIRSAGMLHKEGVQRVVLVTHAFDAPRARRRFEQAGFEVVSAPTQVPVITGSGLGGLAPNANAISDCFYLGYEALAWIADRLLPGR